MGRLLANQETRRDVVAVTFLGFAAALMLSLLGTEGGNDLSRFFCGASPPAAAAVIVIIGAGCLVTIGGVGGLSPPPPLATAGLLLRSLIWLVAFGAIATLTDLLLRFPRDINVATPQALIFYPSVGVIAEVVFHLAPLAAALVLARWFLPRLQHRARTVAAIAVVSLVEPTFQVLAAAEDGGSPLREVLTFVNVYAFSVVQLDLFRRHGFAAMYGFRLLYYLWWHVIWGALRLHFLF